MENRIFNGEENRKNRNWKFMKNVASIDKNILMPFDIIS